jgi:hypothetical protein
MKQGKRAVVNYYLLCLGVDLTMKTKIFFPLFWTARVIYFIMSVNPHNKMQTIRGTEGGATKMLFKNNASILLYLIFFLIIYIFHHCE